MNHGRSESRQKLQRAVRIVLGTGALSREVELQSTDGKSELSDPVKYMLVKRLPST
jgi:hypothetical protein